MGGNKSKVGWTVVAVFALALAFVLANHEMWRDELQAWLLVRDSSSLSQLWANTRYEGHPLLWHGLLYVAAHAGLPPESMQVLNWAVAVAAAAAILLLCPFPFWARALFVFGYLPFYEYGAISRGYALTILGIWIFCAGTTRGRPLAGAAGAAVAVSSSPMGLLFGPAMATVMVVVRSPKWRLATGLFGIVMALAVIQALPAPDQERARALLLHWDPLVTTYLLRGYSMALLPVPQCKLHFWGSSILFPWPATTASVIASTAVVVVALVGTAAVLRRERAALAFWLLSAGVLLSFAYVKFPGGIRHQGFFTVALVAALWLAVGRDALAPAVAAALLTPLLLAGVAGSAIAAWWEVRAPFSGAACASEALREAGLASLPMVGGVDWATSGVAALLPRHTMFYPSIQREGSFVIWNQKRLRQNQLTPAQMVGAATALDEGDGSVLLLNFSLPPVLLQQCEAIACCAPAIVADEAIFVYRCRAAPVRGEGQQPRQQ